MGGLSWIVAAICAFLLGSIVPSLWIGRSIRGIDLREHGSGNLGATNVYRTIGPGWGILVFILDVAKGWVAVWLSTKIVGSHDTASLASLIGLAGAILGHMYSPFASFRGGKGVATAAGGWVALAPLVTGLGLAIWAIAFAITRVVSVASMLAAIWLPIGLIWVGRHFRLDDPILLVGLGTALFLILRHRSNILRLLKGKERPLDLAGPKGSGRP